MGNEKIITLAELRELEYEASIINCPFSQMLQKRTREFPVKKRFWVSSPNIHQEVRTFRFTEY
jgi:hypothetical protein